MDADIERLRGKAAPRDAADLVQILRAGMAPLVDEIKRLRRRVEVLEDAGTKRARGKGDSR